MQDQNVIQYEDFTDDLEFTILKMFCCEEDYFRNGLYEIVIDEYEHVTITFLDVLRQYYVDFRYFKVMDQYDMSLVLYLFDRYRDMHDKDLFSSDKIYVKLFGYKMNTYLKCMILFLSDVDNPEDYRDQLPAEIISEIQDFLLA